MESVPDEAVREKAARDSCMQDEKRDEMKKRPIEALIQEYRHGAELTNCRS